MTGLHAHRYQRALLPEPPLRAPRVSCTPTSTTACRAGTLWIGLPSYPLRRSALPERLVVLTRSIVVIGCLLRPKSSLNANAARIDRPWRRPGPARYAMARLAGFLIRRSPLSNWSPMITDLDVAVASRDGTRLRVNCYRPVSDGPVPVLLCAHPYGKDRLPRRIGRRSHVSFLYRVMRQPGRVNFSTLTSWEAPDQSLPCTDDRVDYAGRRCAAQLPWTDAQYAERASLS